jgi:RNA methyltransferase, TrmH family
MIKTITSAQNPLIKQIGLLGAKARERRQEGLFVAEGLREAGLALQAGYRPVHILFDPAHTPPEQVAQWSGRAAELISVPTAVFEKIAYRSGVPNVVVVFEIPPPTLFPDLPPNPLILVLEAIEKPGNLGAILRTADAAGVDAVLVCDPAIDLFNPNAIRASLGALFTLPVLSLEAEAALSWLRERHIAIYAEATGISDFWVQQADERVIIPMQGKVDSLNVSASTAIILFEAVRQRLAAKKL